MIKLVNISKTYTTGKVRVEALKNVNLTFGDSGLCFIVGKSGSGKSTLLNLLGGLDGATSGDIIVNGKKLGAMTGRAADVYRAEVVGFVFQDYNLIEEIGVKGNLELAQMLKGKKAKATDVDGALRNSGQDRRMRSQDSVVRALHVREKRERIRRGRGFQSLLCGRHHRDRRLHRRFGENELYSDRRRADGAR